MYGIVYYKYVLLNSDSKLYIEIIFDFTFEVNKSIKFKI